MSLTSLVEEPDSDMGPSPAAGSALRDVSWVLVTSVPFHHVTIEVQATSVSCIRLEKGEVQDLDEVQVMP